MKGSDNKHLFYLKSVDEEWADSEDSIAVASTQDFRVINPIVGEELLFRKDLEREYYVYNIVVKVVSVDENRISFQQVNPNDKSLGPVTDIELGKEIVLESYFTFKTNRERPRYIFTLYTIEELISPNIFDGLGPYNTLYENYPDVWKELLPRILKKGNMSLLYNIYHRGLYGVEKDEMRANSYLVEERDYGRYLEWRNSKENKQFLDLIEEKYPTIDDNIFAPDFGYKRTYLIAKYKKDHGQLLDALSSYVSIIKIFFEMDRDKADVSIPTHASLKEIVELIIDNDLYKEYESHKVIYHHYVGYKIVTLPMIYACYLVMNGTYEKTKKRNIHPILVPDDLPKHYCGPGDEINKYIDMDMAGEYLLKASLKHDKIATFLMEKYKI